MLISILIERKGRVYRSINCLSTQYRRMCQSCVARPDCGLKVLCTLINHRKKCMHWFTPVILHRSPSLLEAKISLINYLMIIYRGRIDIFPKVLCIIIMK